jgi:hypothetical protein
MSQSSKRLQIEPSPPLNFFQWICVYLGCALGCDARVQASLYHTMFLYIDLVAVLDPNRLYAGIRERNSPAVDKAEWWERVRRLTIPKLQFLFPLPDCPFRNFDQWFNCNCFFPRFVQGRRFPLRQRGRAMFPDPEDWRLYCEHCTPEGHDIFEPVVELALGITSADELWRWDVRHRLKQSTDIQALYPYTDQAGWTLATNTTADGQRIFIQPGKGYNFQYARVNDYYNIEVNPGDFIAACIILSRSHITPDWQS